jgi:hypothetical protein
MKGAMDYQKALLDPASVFDNPEEVLEQAELTKDQQIEILRRWAYDANEVAVAEEEGMEGDGPLILQRVLETLDKLTDGVDVRHSGPTKLDGI